MLGTGRMGDGEVHMRTADRQLSRDYRVKKF
jgi:hypothetical protein